MVAAALDFARRLADGGQLAAGAGQVVVSGLELFLVLLFGSEYPHETGWSRRLLVPLLHERGSPLLSRSLCS